LFSDFQETKKFHPYFLKILVCKKKMLNKIINLGLPPSSMQMFFEVGCLQQFGWGVLGTTSQAANQIALSLASLTFMFAMGLSVAVTIRVEIRKD
jgi:MATE family multidrug resistance protein